MAETKAKIAELDSSNADCIAEGIDRFAVSYQKGTGLSPDRWKDSVKAIIPRHHGLLAELKNVQVHFQELECKKETIGSALREAQRELGSRNTFTKK
jgi:hypothetical protein